MNDLASMFRFLDALRESGATNMFGAAPFLQEYFDVDRAEARRVHGQWMRTFGADLSASERAAKAAQD